MANENPYRQFLRRKNVHFKTHVRQANATGKDAGANTDFAIGWGYNEKRRDELVARREKLPVQ
jgi:hypothetical protein